MPSLTITTTTNPKTIFFTDDAQTDTIQNPPQTTLLIHGLGSSSCFYKTIIPSLLPYTRCIALDTAGSGLSELGNESQTIESIAEDAISILDEIKVEKVVVVGHSMGGIVASFMAGEWKERVEGVVLLGPVNPTPGMAAVFEKRIEAVKQNGLESLANSIPTAATGSWSTSLHHAFIRSLILGTSPEGYVSLCTVIARAKEPNYSAITVPLLLLAGEDDKTSPLESSKSIFESYGTSSAKKRLEILKGVGHWHCVEAPDRVGSLATEFIKSLS
ncbi:3-oxoadipate enol-lactone hydrolase-like protein [Tricladium varicosporioides]|nr:3-oxoadipate enol-lactone hydrolase-like protein [Hymenoscyphus varicosporioides]